MRLFYTKERILHVCYERYHKNKTDVQEGEEFEDILERCISLNKKTDKKELEHGQLGWTVLILKYDLGKSLSKEMWCKMADIKKIEYIF